MCCSAHGGVGRIIPWLWWTDTSLREPGEKPEGRIVKLLQPTFVGVDKKYYQADVICMIAAHVNSGQIVTLMWMPES